MKARYLAWGWSIACVLVLAGACGDDAAKETSSTGGAGGSGGSPPVTPFAQSPCGLCLATECTTLADRCRAEPECALYIDCVSACPTSPEGLPDTACKDACPPPAGAAATAVLADWSICAEATAGCVECGHAGPQPNPYEGQACGPSSNGNPCLKCYYEKCCEQAAQCMTVNTECELIIACINDCPPAQPFGECVSTCFGEHPTGVQDYLADYACTDVMCTSPDACTGEWATNDCAVCVEEKCAASVSACLENVDCFLTAMCVGSCPEGNDACADGCAASLAPDALALFEAWRICSTQECFAECG